MYRKIILIFTLLFMTKVWADECFSLGGEKYKVKKVSKDGYSITSFKNKKLTNFFYCYPEKGNTHCSGNDDSGEFIVEEGSITLLGLVGLGNPDGPNIFLKHPESISLKNCSL